MSEALQQALSLLAVGMISVFVVLTIVVLTGRSLVQITNWLHTREFRPSRSSPGKTKQKDRAIRPEELAILTALVDHLTEGKGQIARITPLPKDQSNT